MAIDPVSAALDIGGKLIDRLWPDPQQKAAAQLELLKLQQSGDLEKIAGQLKINEIEAAHPSVFVSGWRPAVGWICVIGLFYTFFLQPMLAWVSSTQGIEVPPNLDMGDLLTLLGGMLGLGGLRTFEKINKVASK